jgi:hypothetical protein
MYSTSMTTSHAIWLEQQPAQRRGVTAALSLSDVDVYTDLTTVQRVGPEDVAAVL